MPDSFKHNVTLLGGGQANFQQCWFASYKMLMRSLCRSANEVEAKLKSAGIDVDDSKANGLLDTEYNKAAAALNLQAWSGTAFNQKPGFFDVGLTDGAEAFLEELKKGPLWVSRYLKPGTYHAVLATGYNDNGKGYIIYNNPFPGPDNAVEVTTETANTFVKFITNAKGSVQGKKW